MIEITYRAATPEEASHAFQLMRALNGGSLGCLWLILISTGFSAAFTYYGGGSVAAAWLVLSIIFILGAIAALIENSKKHRKIRRTFETAQFVRVEFHIDKAWQIKPDPVLSRSQRKKEKSGTNWLFRYAPGHFGIIGSRQYRQKLTPLEPDFKMGTTVTADWIIFDKDYSYPLAVKAQGLLPSIGDDVDWNALPAGAYSIDYKSIDPELGIVGDLSGLLAYFDRDLSEGGPEVRINRLN